MYSQPNLHGVLVLGGMGAGKTSLILSLLAHVSGSYPTRFNADIKQKTMSMPLYGQRYDVGQCEMELSEAGKKSLQIILTDTPPCGTDLKQELPLCSNLNESGQDPKQAIPSWMRVFMRGGQYQHSTALFVVDATQSPLWEDTRRCCELVQLLFALKRSEFNAVLVVTKLRKARSDALRSAAYGSLVGSIPVKDPQSSYEVFVSRYIAKLDQALRIQARALGFCLSEEPFEPSYPDIFDAPTWVNVGDYRGCRENKCMAERPNWTYMSAQLKKILVAVSIRWRLEWT